MNIDGSSSDWPLVRFDSLDPVRGARSFRFGGLRRVVRADVVGEVLPALREVERAVAEGLHAAGFVSYEAAPAFDAALVTRAPEGRLPLVWFAIYDERTETEPVEASEDGAAAEIGELRAALGEAEHAARVARIRELIAAGDTYQVNLTFPLRSAFRGSVANLYGRLCHAQRAAYCALIDLGDAAIVSASPELFFRWAGGELELRPMKGTRARGGSAQEDAEIAAELAASSKDRAENLMIVDLLRNDAGRIAEFGGVRVERMFEVERYPTVHQMTSTIRARTRPGLALTDVFRALFPCGSVTGAPKVRTAQIIAELEGAPRGVYTGAIGFASPGEAVFSVAIRTLVVDRAAGVAELGVGSGITWDSDAAAEYRECLAKAAFVHREPDPALIETFGWSPEEGFVRLRAHLARLAASAEHFGYGMDAEALARQLDALAATLPREARTVRVTLHPTGRIDVSHQPMRRWTEPVRLAVAARRLPGTHPLWRHKTARREIYRDHAPVSIPHDDVLLVNERGELAETRIANLVLEIGGELWTPHAAAGLLPGVLRAELLRDGAIRERTLHLADLERAAAVWVINSLRGWGRAALVSEATTPAGREMAAAVE